MQKVAAILFCVFVAFTWARPDANGPIGGSLIANFDKIPEQYQEFVPEEVKKFVDSLTPEDKATLKELAGKHAEYNTEDQVMEAIKTKSPTLYEKVNNLRTLVKGKIDSLEPEAKTFVNNLIEKAKSLKPKAGEKPNISVLREEATKVIEQWKALSQAAKDDLKAKFPQIHSVLENEKFQKLAKGLLKTDGEAAPAS